MVFFCLFGYLGRPLVGRAPPGGAGLHPFFIDEISDVLDK